VDLGWSGWHETKLGWAAYDEAVRDFAATLRGIRERGMLAPQDIICLHTVRSDRFLVFLGGSDGADGGAPARRERLMQSLRQSLAQAPEGAALRSLRLAACASRVREHPLARPERSIQQAVAEAILGSLAEREGADEERHAELARLINEGRIRSVFHPIVRLADRGVVGHEALTRASGGSAFESVEELFAFAESTDLLLEFERLCRNTAIGSFARLPRSGLLFLNASARALFDPEWLAGSTLELLAASGLRPHDVVVEVTERIAVVRHEGFESALAALKERGFRVAVDDMGAGYASLQTLASIEPDFLKFDVSLVRDIDKSSIKRSLLESLRALADKIRARVIAEGVEREAELDTLRALGIELGQGFHFHREEPVA
jgi:EAL domain-containing protein (putative c-di-GMP-specific phosphodiesterase class I)